MSLFKKFTKARIIGFIFSIILPIAVIVFGSILLAKGFLLTICFGLAFYAIPLAMIVLFFALIFTKLKNVLKIIFGSVLTFILIVSFFVLFLYGYFEVLDTYEGTEVAENYKESGYFPMPSLNEIGEPTKTEYYCFFSRYIVFFGSDTDTLICTYNDVDYNEQKKLLDEKYAYMEDKSISIDGYDFRFIEESEGDGYYISFPKYLMLVATNDASNEVVYISFQDDDIDYITSLKEFVLVDCGFRRIR
ncbi:MAG: hypothetical protein J6A53_06460 [Clostridia bacterium]|nr:hypothetical protein [Clostridia bacterium]MBO5440279.1 hypothetical protein [Clostridia bacterium]